MIVISHRGYWKQPAEKNSVEAFSRSFNLGLGTETDIRDHCCDLVISHDMPAGNEISLVKFLDLLQDQSLPLALNIKADGLAEKIKSVMTHYDRDNWFVFDMSIPDMRAHLACGNPVYARVSEIEPEPVCFDEITGIWLDAFYYDDWRLERIGPWLAQGKRVCLVSPELHGRDHQPLWKNLRETGFIRDPHLMLCTDHPEDAQQYFGNIP
jgi:hypothetical protein